MTQPYEESIGIWHHVLGKVEHDIFPEEGDNIKIARIAKNGPKNGLDWLCQEINKLYFEMVTREPSAFEREQGSLRTPVPAQDHPKLRRWIEMNQKQIEKDIMLKFGWQTKEQQDRLENMNFNSDEVKKLIGGA